MLYGTKKTVPPFHGKVIDMPRTARKTSSMNIYHVMLRGINRQNIFEDDEDRLYFMNVLASSKKTDGFKLYAFVLMSNHIHLLIEPAEESLSMIFKKIGTRYAVWYNRKHGRSGHLFQDRYRSESIESELYFMTVLRYILQNPMKAGLESRPGSYRWSSYLAYKMGKGTVTDTQYALELYGSRETLGEYLLQENDDFVMDEADHDWLLRDDQAKEILTRVTKCTTVSDFQLLDPSVQKEYVTELSREKLSMGQISRLTGIPKTTVYRIIQKDKPLSFEAEGAILRESTPDIFNAKPDTIW